jgi:hypothetical protein
MLLGLLALVRAAVELAEAEVAVGDEGAHAEFFRHAESLPVMLLRVLQRRRLEAGGDVTEQVKGVGLEVARAPLAARRQRFLRAPAGVIRAPG